jgi:hypothetical protein
MMNSKYNKKLRLIGFFTLYYFAMQQIGAYFNFNILGLIIASLASFGFMGLTFPEWFFNNNDEEVYPDE